MTTTTAFIGLGVMGGPMAGHLAKAGHSVHVYNRTKSKADAWAAANAGTAFATPGEAARGADCVFICVGADQDVLDVVLGPDGALAAMNKGAVLVDHSTVSAETARILEKAAAEKGVGFVDAPVSGGEAGAINGALTIMCGGTEASFVDVEPVMQAYGKRIKLLGNAGAGQQAKMANQICIAGILQGLSEALSLVEAAGLKGEDVIDVISAGAAGSWQMENRAKTMLKGEYDFGFAVDWMRKDLGIVLGEARSLGLSLPVTALVDQFYADVQAMDGGRQDTSSLYRRYAKKS